MSNSPMSEEASGSPSLTPLFLPISPLQHEQQPQTKAKKKRGQPGNPDPEAEVVALSPKSLMATNRFVCEICNKGFQRDQNLQLHRRGHNLPWKLRQKSSKEVARKRVYVCPEATCVHHHPSRALGDLTGIKKHYSRKHGEKKWKCDKCSKRYAVQSDWKAHVKTCGTREYRCDCGTLFSRKDSFVTHRAFCDALAQESARLIAAASAAAATTMVTPPLYPTSSWYSTTNRIPNPNSNLFHMRPEDQQLLSMLHPYHPQLNNTNLSPASLSATALLQKATSMGALPITNADGYNVPAWEDGSRLTRDFLGVVDDGSDTTAAQGSLTQLPDLVSRGESDRMLTRSGFPSLMDTWHV